MFVAAPGDHPDVTALSLIGNDLIVIDSTLTSAKSAVYGHEFPTPGDVIAHSDDVQLITSVCSDLDALLSTKI